MEQIGAFRKLWPIFAILGIFVGGVMAFFIRQALNALAQGDNAGALSWAITACMPLPGIFITTAVYWRTIKRQIAETGTAGTRHRRIFRIAGSLDDAKQLSQQAISSLPGARVTRNLPDEARIEAVLTASGRLHANLITIDIRSQGPAEQHLIVETRPKFSFVVDGGANFKNIEQIQAFLLERAQQNPQS